MCLYLQRGMDGGGCEGVGMIKGVCRFGELCDTESCVCLRCMSLWICTCVYECLHVPTNAHGCYHGSQHMELNLMATAGQAGLISLFTFFLQYMHFHVFVCIQIFHYT